MRKLRRILLNQAFRTKAEFDRLCQEFLSCVNEINAQIAEKLLLNTRIRKSTSASHPRIMPGIERAFPIFFFSNCSPRDQVSSASSSSRARVPKKIPSKSSVNSDEAKRDSANIRDWRFSCLQFPSFAAIVRARPRLQFEITQTDQSKVPRG